MKRRRALAVAVATLLAAAAPLVAASGAVPDPWTARPATYRVHTTTDVRIPMSDGTLLTADIHRPALADGSPAPGRFPTLLTQTPYNKNIQNPAAPYFVERGYVDVVVDIRGTGSSEGAFDASFSAASQRDSYELVQWAAAQPWSTGRVGMHGGSYLGITQLLAAAQQPPALKAIFPIVPTGDNYRTNFPGGYLTSLFPFALQNAANGLVPPGYTADDPAAAARSMSEKAGGVVIQTGNVAGLMAGDHRAYDGPAYRSISALWLVDRIEVPTFLVGGWYDALSQRDAPLLFRELQRRKVPVKLAMGDWYHTNPGEGLPAGGLPALEELQLRWFDRYVRGVADAGLAKLGPVVYKRLGTDSWHSAPTWPVPGLRYVNAYLGGTSGPGTAGTLGGAPPADAGTATLPWHPVAGPCSRSTYVGTFGLAPTTPCETDDRVNDVTGLVYELDVGVQPLDLTGHLSARLFVSTTRADAFVTLHLSDVDPATGAASEITGGWDSLVFRALDEQRSYKVGPNYVIPFHPYTQDSLQAVEAGTVYEWWVELRPAAARIAPGHKLRLSIQPSDTVRFLPTGERLSEQAGGVVTIHHGPRHPSSIVLPVGSS